MEERIGSLELRVEMLDRRCADIESALMSNTELTHSVGAQIKDMTAQIHPVLDAMSAMEAGIRTLGRIGRFGERFGRLILFLIALGVVVKFIFGGASWSDAVAAFSKVTGH